MSTTKQFIMKGPCPKELESELKHLSDEEKAIILAVIQKDLELKEAVAISKEDKDIVDDWNKRVNNMTVPLSSAKGRNVKDLNFYIP